MTASALTIANSDSTGATGIQADLKTFAALGVHGASVVTALLARSAQGVPAVHEMPADFVRMQMDAVFSGLDVNAVKIGMLSKPEMIETVATGLDAYGPKMMVLDPGTVAENGDPLVEELINVLIEKLFPRALLVTASLHEAQKLLGGPVAETRKEMEQQGRALLTFGPRAVLVTGGRFEDEEAADVLVAKEGVEWFSVPGSLAANTPGNGFSFSSAIAAGLAKGLTLASAIHKSKERLSAAPNVPII